MNRWALVAAAVAVMAHSERPVLSGLGSCPQAGYAHAVLERVELLSTDGFRLHLSGVGPEALEVSAPRVPRELRSVVTPHWRSPEHLARGTRLRITELFRQPIEVVAIEREVGTHENALPQRAAPRSAPPPLEEYARGYRLWYLRHFTDEEVDDPMGCVRSLAGQVAAAHSALYEERHPLYVWGSLGRTLYFYREDRVARAVLTEGRRPSFELELASISRLLDKWGAHVGLVRGVPLLPRHQGEMPPGEWRVAPEEIAVRLDTGRLVRVYPR